MQSNKKQNRKLFICNSVYQLLVALWIKNHYYTEISADIILSDHMNGTEQLVEQVKASRMFQEVYGVSSMDYARYRVPLTRKERIAISLRPQTYLRKYVELKECYSELLIANVDAFSQLVYDALAHRQKQIPEVTVFEDGIFTYSKLYEKDYLETNIIVTSSVKKLIHKYIYRKKLLYGNLSKILVFNKENMRWNPPCKVVEMDKIKSDDRRFKEMVNQVFQYQNNDDVYDTKYIFMEESFLAEGTPINDVVLLKEIAKKVGKQNIMVKIHPRNKVNRFEKEGFKTNHNISIPWEVIVMNIGDISDKVFITVSSASVMNPILIFGQNVKAYSLYNLIEHEKGKSRLLSGELWETVYWLFQKYNDMISICKSVDEIQ